MAEDPLYTEETRKAVRNNWVVSTKKYLEEDDDFQKLLGIENIQQIWRNVGIGSGTNAEALARLTAQGYGDLIDEIKEHMNDTSQEIVDHFKLKIK